MTTSLLLVVKMEKFWFGLFLTVVWSKTMNQILRYPWLVMPGIFLLSLVMTGGGRKVGHVLFHPTADHLLVSCGADLRTKLWDVEKGKEASELRVHGEVVQSVDWNYRGNLLGTTCRDKKIRIIDMRQRQVAQEAQGHQGIKGSRLIWLGETNCIATTGFSKSSDRQVMVFDTRQITVQPLQQMSIDASSGVLMPFYDNDSHMLFLAGKG